MIVQEQKMKREKSLVVQAFYDISTHSPRFLDTGCRRDLPHLKVRKFLWANRSDMHCISFCLEEVSKIPHIPGYMRVKNLTNKHYRSRLLSSTAGTWEEKGICCRHEDVNLCHWLSIIFLNRNLSNHFSTFSSNKYRFYFISAYPHFNKLKNIKWNWRIERVRGNPWVKTAFN